MEWYQDKSNDLTEDWKFWSDLIRKDKAALAYFFKKYYSLILNYGLKICSDDQIVEDAVQDTFVKLWAKKKLPDVTSPRAYLLKSFKNTLLNKLIRERNGFRFPFQYADTSSCIQDDMIEQELQCELLQKINKGLDSLPERQREILYLRFYRDMDYREIADILEINYQSVRNSIHESVKKLRKSIISLLIIVGFRPI